MLPYAYPSSVNATTGRRQMVVYFLSSVTGLQRWVDYIPVRYTTSVPAKEASYDQAGYVAIEPLASIAGKQKFVDYMPVYVDSNASDAWKVDLDGYIPIGTSGGGGASLYLDFTSSTQTLDPRITFSRASNATVTGSDGLIKYAPHNLLTYSEQFDNAAWAKTNTTVTANAVVSPSGALTGDKLVETAVTDVHYISEVFTPANATTYTGSVFLKAAERGYAFVGFATGSMATTFISVDLSNGSISTATGTPVSSSSVSVGNGWYKVSITLTSTGTVQSAFDVRLSTNGNWANRNYAGDGTSGIYVWGAQLEIGSTATTYNPTTVKNLLGYSEAFDNAAWTKTNSFVQTNVTTYSQDFDNAAWTKDGVLAFGSGSTANATTAPNGTTTADLITPNTANGYHRVFNSGGATTTIMTFSAYVKSNGYNKVGLRESASTGAGAAFDLSTGTVIGAYNAGGSTVSNMTISDQGNGWYRISCTVSFASNTTMSLGVQILSPSYVAGTDLQTFWTPNGTSGIYLWGAQLVQGSVAGDYQATYAAAAPVQYAAPNGTLTADKLVENTAASTFHQTSQNYTAGIAGTTYTASFYLKAAERTSVAVSITDNATGDVTAIANLTSGTIGTATISGNWSSGSASITSVGNGWYRASVTATKATGGNALVVGVARLVQTGTTTSYTGDGTSGVYIWGAQLSDSASVDTYVNNPVAAPSAAAYYGPRFDYDPVTLQPKGLLIEEQRTNLVTYSEDLTNAAWAKSTSSISANSSVAPDGTTTADKVVEDTSTGVHSISRSGITVSSATSYTYTVYAKAGERNWIALQFTGGVSASHGAYFDLTNGVVGNILNSPTATSITAVGNGWYRCSVTATTTSTSLNLFAYLASANGTVSYAGNGTNGASIWGAQLEAGAFATSYIPTVASQVTRSADVALIQGSNFSSWYNVNEGTVYADVNATDTASRRVLSLSGGPSPRLVDIYTGSGPSRFVYYTNINGAQYDVAPLTGSLGSVKLAVTYSSTGTTSTQNGASASVGTTVSAVATAGQTIRLEVGAWNNASQLNGTIKRISYYNRRLANTELQGITS